MWFSRNKNNNKKNFNKIISLPKKKIGKAIRIKGIFVDWPEKKEEEEEGEEEKVEQSFEIIVNFRVKISQNFPQATSFSDQIFGYLLYS